MRKKALSGILLTLLLIGMLSVASNIQPLKGDLKTNETEKGSQEQAKIVEHRITTLELEKLKQIVGVGEEERNYNQIINGHGTGLGPPTDKEWAEIADKIYVVETITLDPKSDPPSSIDHTTGPWFPPIGNQGPEGSCTTWAVGYYVKTFQEAKEHGWDLSDASWIGGDYGHPTTYHQDRIFSPDFIYHQINDGVDGGSSFYDAISLVCSIGACSWQKMPYNPANSISWPSESAWREAPWYRGNSSGFESLELNTDEDLVSLKNWLASDNLAVIGVDAAYYGVLTSGDLWTLDNYLTPTINHANTIVGYDDSMEYTEEEETRYGAFKIANSWGKGSGGVGSWENVPDGCYWISYEAMKQRVGYCMFYRDRIGYEPKLVTSFKMDHPKRGECGITFGMGNKSAPIQAKRFDNWTSNGGNHPFPSNNIVLDITEFNGTVPSVLNQSFFMQVYDGGHSPHSGEYEWYSDGEAYSWFRLNQTFDIPETGATLKFWNYYEIENDWDYGYVEVHDLDTDEWYTLPGLKTVSTLPERQNNPNCPAEFEPTAYYDAGRWNAFTGFSLFVYQEEMNLTPFANHTIKLYFTYWTDPYTLESGWYIDDIEIPEIGFFDDVESGPNGWTYNGWSIATPPPSDTGTVLSFSVEYYHNYSSGTLCAISTSHDVPLNTTNQDFVFAELALKNIWIVDDDGPSDYLTIQEAINAPETLEGQVIFVKEGTYYENVCVNKSLSLVGADRSATIIDGNYIGTVMNITASNVTISGFTIQNSGNPNSGIYIGESSTNISISYNIIAHNDLGIYLFSSNNNSVSGNTVSNNANGIRLDYSNNNTVFGNTLLNNVNGIWLNDSSDNEVFHNNFFENTQNAYNSNSTNTWDIGYPSGGNYWSNYTDLDLYSGPNQDLPGSDGIWDTSYVIDGDNEDGYPLTIPWGYAIGVESNTTITNMFATISALHFETSGPDGTTGYVNVTLPVGLNNTAVRVFVDDTEITPPPFPIITTNHTHYFIYFEFTQSTHNMTIQYGTTRDTAVTNVTPSKTVIGEGYSMSISVTVENQGNCTETFNVTVYANTVIIKTFLNITLTSGNSTTLTFTWDTTSFAKGSYSIKAKVSQVLGEIDTADNTFIGGIVQIVLCGDVNADGKVDMKDIGVLCVHYGAEVGDQLYVPNYDIDGDGKINMKDIGVCCIHYGEEA